MAFASLVLALPAAHAEHDFGAKLALDAGPSVNAVNTYFGAYAYAQYMCSISYNTAKSLARLPEQPPETVELGDFRGCIRQYTPTLKTLHVKAQKTLKTPAQKAALKEHLALAITALQGIAPLTSERVIDYERRTNAESRSVEQQKNRFEAE